MTNGSDFFARLPGIRPVPGWVLGSFVGAHTGLLLTVHSPFFVPYVAEPLQNATNGWVTASLAANALMGVILLGGLLWAVPELRRRDLGIPTGWIGGWKLLNAVLVVYLVWGLAQLLVVGVGLLGLTTIVSNPSWFPPVHLSRIGPSVLSVIGGAALEEVIYRGLLFVHVLLALQRWGLRTQGLQLAGALVGSQLLFGLNHVPVGLNANYGGSRLVLYVLEVSLVGIFFAVLYMRTNNLFLVMGLHALINAPGLPFVGRIDASLFVLLLALALVLAQPLLARWFSRVLGTGSPFPSSSPPPFGGRF